ncbi:beta-galactosidase [Mucilaginibacter mali]|uniref:Beta-galactosidase n=1 Tax=Mucilaginibacter mali TaxID=2740462 RepID=A0A7D4PUA1_9SPHI|nr:beta-galactosidase [Mucilaginibacter mali]QKJ30183.1 beta-galactosidase [Mucilaginibacter mali]
MPAYLKHISLLAAFAGWFGVSSYAQSVEEHTVALGKYPAYVENNHFKQGTNVDPKGQKFDLNNWYLRRGGKPVLPIMGEFHYSRYPRAEWEQALLQMKAAGIQVIALYNFWNHHEEEEGHFRFDDNRDVRYFLQLCAKHGLQAVVRVGPWAHGEARNGGYPDWYVKKRLKSGTDRASTNGNIQPEVVTWYTELAKQFKGLYYKDGGPIIGLQVDNEVRSTSPQSAGYQYMAALKKLAVSLGMDVPFYVVTGWPGPIVPEDDVLPLWGGYAEAPWTQNTKELPPNNLYTFITDRRDKNIGNDINKPVAEEASQPIYRHPFLTVEMGPGIQITYLRRPIIKPADVMGMLYTRLGTGANMLGYYVFHGTQHPLSWDGSYPTQESKTGIYPYPNDYPLISYDFQAPLNEWGYPRESYHDLKLLHQFISSYTEKLAPMFSTIPADNPSKPDDMQTLRYAVRNKGNSGFVFFNNYTRHANMAAHQAAFIIKTAGETIRIPEKGGINISDGDYGALPFNDNAGGLLIKYATVHPSAVLGNSYFYYPIGNIKPEFKLDNKTIAQITFASGKAVKDGGFTYLTDIKPGKNCVASITTKSGKKVKLIILTKEEAKNSYTFDIKGIKTLLIADKQAFYDEVKDSLTIRSVGNEKFSFYTYPAIRVKNKDVHAATTTGIFNRYDVALKSAARVDVPFKQVSDDKRMNQYASAIGQTPLKPAYGVNYLDTLPYKAYELSLPKRLPANVYDVLIFINYQANTAAIYANGKIIADDYYGLGAMPFSLRREQQHLAGDKFMLQLTPMIGKTNIYFEPGTDTNFKDNSHAVLNGITTTPVYQVVF